LTATDGEASSEITEVSLLVTPVNDAPLAQAKEISIPNGEAVQVELSGSDLDGTTPSFRIKSGPAHGTLSGSAPLLTYTPTEGYSGSDFVTYTAFDGELESAEATVTLIITAAARNKAPLAPSLTVNGIEDSPITISLGCTDPDNDALSHAITTPPANGTLTFTGATAVYTPKANFNGTDSFTYRVSDGSLASELATITIKVAPVNDAPIAANSTLTGKEDCTLPVILPGSDVDNDPLKFTVLKTPTNGTLTGTVPNLVFTPAANWYGTASLQYTVGDGKITTAVITLTLNITNVNDAPVAKARTASVAEDSSIALTLTGSDIDREALYFKVCTQPANGTVTGTAPNIRYTPNKHFTGTDRFTFTVADRSVTSSPAEVVITVTPVNDAPVAVAAYSTVTKNTARSLTLAGTDVDGDRLSYVIVKAPAKGTLSGTAPNLVYTPVTGYTGSDSLQFTVSDGKLTSAAATVSLTIQTTVSTTSDQLDLGAVTTSPDALVVSPGGSASLLLSGASSVLANDQAPEGTTLTATLDTAPESGVLTLSPDGSFQFEQDSSSTNLVDTATYTAVGLSAAQSTQGTLTIHLFRVLGGEVSEAGTELEFSIVKGLRYTVEVLDTVPYPNAPWSVLTEFNGELTGIGTVVDTSPLGGDRYYRVRCTAGSRELVTEPWLRAGATAQP
ncbi:MAG: tandem-95 repeat protein, partial [Verrucomicrobiales bacterium]|nr:tandem-95 repeat protein [Verrucomicrobiales bacterium]